MNKFITTNKVDIKRINDRNDSKIKQVTKDCKSNVDVSIQHLNNEMKHDMQYMKEDINENFIKHLNDTTSTYNHKVEQLESKLVDLEMKQLAATHHTSNLTMDNNGYDKAITPNGSSKNMVSTTNTSIGNSNSNSNNKYVTTSSLNMLLNKNNNHVVQMIDGKIHNRIQRSTVEMEKKINHILNHQVNDNIAHQIANNNHTYMEEEMKNKLAILQTEM